MQLTVAKNPASKLLLIVCYWCVKITTQLSPSSSCYNQLTVENGDLCSPIQKRHIELKEKCSQPAALSVRPSPQGVSRHDHDWTVDFRCKFVVQHKDGGVFAVIQRLDLRRNHVTDECIDYVQFTRYDGSSSPKFCGNFTFNAWMQRGGWSSPAAAVTNAVVGTSLAHQGGPVVMTTNVAGNAFIDVRGHLQVDVYVANTSLKRNERTDFELVFTAYHVCRKIKDIALYQPCGNSVEQRDFCINSTYFNDGIVNCPFTGCVDEGGCTHVHEVRLNEKFSIGNKVLIGSISTLFVMFGVFIVCMWICRSYRVFCWTDTFANPPPTNLHVSNTQSIPIARVIELTDQIASVDVPEVQPQHNNASSRPVDDDKDLPPSYESLFPSR